MDHRTKIKLSNIFGKASALTATAGASYITYEALRLMIDYVNTSVATMNPADYLLPGIVGAAVAIPTGLFGMYMGHTKKQLIEEFNHQVRREMADIGFELVDDQELDVFDEGKKSSKPRWVRREVDEHRPIYVQPYYHDRFFEGYIWGSFLNGGGRSSSSSSSRSSSRSSSSSSNGKGAGAVIAFVALAVAAAASYYLSYKSLRLNFGKVPALLTEPAPDVFESAKEAPALTAK